MSLLRITACAVVCLGAISAAAQDRATKVKNDRTRIQEERYWIYNDLPTGVALARQTGRPLLVVFRCIPCEHCAQLDEKVVEQDPIVRSLMNLFVCVRIVHANGMDLSLFQFDYDQSWTAFLLNADLTIYGRYGTRSHQTESDNDISLEGFAKALSAALELHQQFPLVKDKLVAKHGADSVVKVPEDLPNLKGKYGARLDYEGKVVQSCIHCHQIGESQRFVARTTSGQIPEPVMYPYPHPKSLGLIMDPKEKARVREVTPGTPGAKAGFQVGDNLVTMQGQPLLSIADIQWVLQQTGDSASLPVTVDRGGKSVTLSLILEPGWRRLGDISWRATTWEIRRMVTGGLVLEDLPDAERRKVELSDTQLALFVKYVGQFGEHAAGKQAGVQQGDILVSVDNRTSRMTESSLMAHLLNTKRIGDRVPMTVLRGNTKLNVMLPIQ